MAKNFNYTQEELEAASKQNAILAGQQAEFNKKEDEYIFEHKYDKLIAAGIAGLLFCALINIVAIALFWVNFDELVANASNISVGTSSFSIPMFNMAENVREALWIVGLIASIGTIILAITFLFVRTKKLRMSLAIVSFFMLGALLISFFVIEAIFATLVIVGKDLPKDKSYKTEILIKDLEN